MPMFLGALRWLDPTKAMPTAIEPTVELFGLAAYCTHNIVEGADASILCNASERKSGAKQCIHIFAAFHVSPAAWTTLACRRSTVSASVATLRRL
jgi:hypothetical protein